MNKTTIIYTALPTGAVGGAGPDGRLRLSVFIAPRLWNDDQEEAARVLTLADFPLFADWPERVRDLKLEVRLDGGITLDATTLSADELRSDVWRALFPPETPVKPFRFDNLADTPIQTIDSVFLEDWLRELYRRVGTETGYGLGADKPSAQAMQNDPGIRAIARPSEPEPPYVPPPKTHVPVPYSPPSEEAPQGCMYWPVALLQWLVAILSFIAGLFGLGALVKLPDASPQPAPPEQAPETKSVPPSAQAEGGQPSGSGGAQPQTFAAPGWSAGLAPDALEAFDKVTAFLRPFKKYGRIEDVPPKLDEEQLASLLDFHDGVALAGDYPTLLRALGLVVDLEIDWPADLPETGRVWIGHEPIDGADAHSPRTHYRLTSHRFLPEPRGPRPETRDGLLRLNDEQRYRIIQADVVGASVKVQNAATAVMAQTIPGLQPANPPAVETLPALRSAGLSVVQRDLALQLAFTYQYSAGLQNRLAQVDGSSQVSSGSGSTSAAPTDELWAEDVIRGYRMDVRDLDGRGKWRSLHQRVGQCRFTRDDPPIEFDIEDEGFVQIGTTGPVAEGAVAVQRVADTVATWTGWSLTVERPGKALVEAENGENLAQGDTNSEEMAKTAFKMTTSFKPVPASLPRLRFGHRYQVRVRTVDLAGNSVFGPTPTDMEFQAHHDDDTPARPYHRYEPVPSPAVVLKEPPIEGESVERLVIRSTEDPNDPYHVSRPSSERHIVPPKASQLMAEHHGLFDMADGKPSAAGETYELAAREANTLSHQWVQMPSFEGLAQVPIEGIQFLPETEGSGEKELTFWQARDAFPLRFLPDPLARQAVLRNLPGPAENVATSIPFGSEWPGRLPLRLRLVAIAAGQSPAPPRLLTEQAPDDVVRWVLEVELPPGERRVVRLNSGTEPSDLPQLGVWDWETQPPSGQHQIVSSNTAQGMNWLLMPYRELELVHATQRPLAIPKLRMDKPVKQSKDTAVRLAGHAEVHGKTTGKVDLLGFWTDPVDDPNKDGPSERDSRAAIGEIKVESPGAASVEIGMTHNLGDTKYHRVIYAARGSSRFREYMPEALLEDENADDLLSRPTESEIGQQISAGTLDNFAVVEVRNSSRPLAPDIVYVVPTLGKVVPQTSQVPGGETTVTRRRFGNGLRVFLRRPWFSSGAGELLAVVIQNMDEMASTPPVPPPYVTEWANDPIVNASTVPLVVRPDNFRATAGEPTKVKLDELDRSVTVVGYEVEFDPDRGLWFADIEFTGLDSYMPMVRLALARFQPKSVDDTHISRVVRTDYVQPLPDRTLTISRPSDSPGPLTVTLTGIEPEVTGAKPLVRVWIEVLAKPGQGELGWEEMAITPQVSATPADLWRGIFDLASASLQSGRRYRLVIQESAPVSAVSGATAAEARLDRIVYADTWDIPTDN